jgi:hypothetical protein
VNPFVEKITDVHVLLTIQIDPLHQSNPGILYEHFGLDRMGLRPDNAGEEQKQNC